MNRQFLLTKLSPYENKSKLLFDNQNTSDIIATILKAHRLYSSDYDKICLFFWKGSLTATCNYIWHFLKNNVKYKIEPDTRQSVKSPSAILSTGQYINGYNDCKHYSQFIGGVLSALCRRGKKINWCYRFANYKLFATMPHHVFVVVTSPAGEIWVDPVLNSFNNKKRYINKIDRKI
jgi:hypothetical protein